MYANAEVNGIGRQTLPDSETEGPSDSIWSITAYEICAHSVCEDFRPMFGNMTALQVLHVTGK